MCDLDVRRQDENGRLRRLIADRTGRSEAFCRVRRRHSNVDDREVRLVLANELEELLGIATLADHVEACSIEQARQAFAQEDFVVRNDYAVAARGFLANLRLHESIIRQCRPWWNYRAPAARPLRIPGNVKRRSVRDTMMPPSTAGTRLRAEINEASPRRHGAARAVEHAGRPLPSARIIMAGAFDRDRARQARGGRAGARSR